MRAGALLLVGAALLLAVAAAVASPGCRRPSRDEPAGSAKLMVIPFDLARPETKLPIVVVRVASTPEQRHRGMGGRDRLDEGEGMLFVYPSEEPRTYWMKDCFTGLDIAFIGSDLRIANVATLPPGANLPDPDVPRADSARPALYVLEVPPGWLGKHRIAAGDEVDISRALYGVTPR